MKIFSRLVLVLSALLVPNLILSVASWFSGREFIALGFGLAGAIGILCTVLVIYSFRTKYGGVREQVKSIKRFNADFFSHIISYIPALLAFSFTSDVEVWTMICFYAFYIFALAFSDIVVLNPILFLLGWRNLSATIISGSGTEEICVVIPPKVALNTGSQILISISNFGLYLKGEDD